VKLIDDDVGGIGVHIAARLLEFSGPDEVVVSGSVPPLVIGSGLHVVAHGNYQLRGVPGDWPIFKVDE
jgi:class 3 adenylate cyclase